MEFSWEAKAGLTGKLSQLFGGGDD